MPSTTAAAQKIAQNASLSGNSTWQIRLKPQKIARDASLSGVSLSQPRPPPCLAAPRSKGCVCVCGKCIHHKPPDAQISRQIGLEPQKIAGDASLSGNIRTWGSFVQDFFSRFCQTRVHLKIFCDDQFGNLDSAQQTIATHVATHYCTLHL